MITVSPNEEDSRKATILVTNTGNKPATNVSLWIETPKNIVNVTNSFSTSNIIIFPDINQTFHNDNTIELKKFNISSLNFYIPKFGFGDGSRINIELLIDGNKSSQYYDYNAIAVFNEGSTIAKIEKPGIQSSFIEVIQGIQKTLGNYFPLFLIAFISYIIFLKTFYDYMKVQREKEYDRGHIIKNVIEIRNNIKYNKNYKEKINTKLWLEKFYGSKQYLFKDINLIIALDDFYNQITIRNSKINADERELIKINKDCINLASRALKIITTSKLKYRFLL